MKEEMGECNKLVIVPITTSKAVSIVGIRAFKNFLKNLPISGVARFFKDRTSAKNLPLKKFLETVRKSDLLKEKGRKTLGHKISLIKIRF